LLIDILSALVSLYAEIGEKLTSEAKRTKISILKLMLTKRSVGVIIYFVCLYARTCDLFLSGVFDEKKA
jgi:hypothetical protein